MTRAFWKDTQRSITGSVGRFMAIALIAALGAGFYAGLRMSGPDMRLAADEFYDGTNLCDMRVVCTWGLSDQNIEQLRQVDGVKEVSPAYEADALADIGQGSYVVRVHSLDVDAARASDVSNGQRAVSDDDAYMNRPLLVEGEWPSSPDECIVSADAIIEDPIRIGDTITLTEAVGDLEDSFAETTLTVVGIARFSYYSCLSSMGSSSLGSGEVDQVLMVPSAAFASELPFTEAFITVEGAQELHGSSDDYDQLVGQVCDRLDECAQDIAASRLDDERSAAQDELDRARAEYEEQEADAQAALDEAKAQLDAVQAQLSSAESQLAGLAALYGETNAAYAQASAEYEAGLAEYEEGRASYEQQRADVESELADARAQLDDAQAEIDDMQAPECYVLDRSKLIGAESYESDAARIDSIAAVFPFMFFLVAALVSLTTMARMVEEERILIGTYKALGYSKGTITAKYLIYALAASGIGSVAGILVLSKFLPALIMEAYSVIYIVPQRPLPIDIPLAVASFAMSVGVTVLATLYAAMSTLRERPALLMLPRAPKPGKRILLERVRPLWRRLSFSWKVTMRNIFRYKQRFFMAVIGIAGCTALLLTGLGLQNSINDIIDKQYGEIYSYSMTVHLDDGDEANGEKDADAAEGGGDAEDAKASDAGEGAVGTNAEDAADANDAEASAAAVELLNTTSSVEGYALVHAESVIARSDSTDDEVRVELVVPQSADDLARYVAMHERISGVPLQLDNQGAIISEKLGKTLGIGVGDQLTICEQDAVGNASGSGVRVRVSGLMENYVGMYAYLSTDAYAQTFGSEPTFDAIYVEHADDADNAQQLIDELGECENVKTVAHNNEVIATYRAQLKSVDAVVVVLIAAAALLAFVVLYNLTNINISERVREIATLKVLGFTPAEVNAYIFREVVILSFIGALLGLVLGIGMEGFVVVTAEVDQVMFGRQIHAASYVVAFALTMLFTVVVMLFMRRKLARVDMVESLKSNE